MKKKSQLILSLIFFLFFCENSNGNIKYPWRSTAVIVKNSDTFKILFDNIKSHRIDSVQLVSQFFRESVQIDSVNVGKFEYDHFTEESVNNEIWVNVSNVIPEDIYDLYIY